MPPSESYFWQRRFFPNARVAVFLALIFFAVALSSQAQIPIPGGTASQYSYDYDSGMYVESPNSTDLEYAGGGSKNGEGGDYIIFYNPDGGSFGGQNWGGEVYAGGMPDGDSNTIMYTAYSGYLFQPPPGAQDTAIIGPVATGFVQGDTARDSDSLAGASEQDVGDYNNEPYIYPGVFQGTTTFSYTVDLGGNSVAETFAVAGDTSSDNGITAASPNFNLSGSYTSTQDALVAGNDDLAITFNGSAKGSFSSPFLDLYGRVNVDGGELSGDFLLIDAQVDPNIPLVDDGPVTVTQTAVDVDGSNASIVSSKSLLIGRSSDLAAELTIEDGASGTFNNVYVGCGDEDSSGTLTIGDGKVEIDGFLEVGSGGSGTLMVTDGATLTTGVEQDDTDTGAYISGADEDTPASATVDGDGSTWTNTGNLAIGFSEDAPSTLTVSNGGAVTVSGELILGNGDGGSAVVDINSGGTLETGTAQESSDTGGSVGDAEDSTASVTITGAGSKWTVDSSLLIGGGGNGTVTVENGGALEVDGDNVIIGSNDGTGELDLEGTSGSSDSSNAVGRFRTFASALTTPTLMVKAGMEFIVGDEAKGTFNVINGASVDVQSASFTVGSDAGTGTFNVTDPGNVEIDTSDFSEGADEGSTGTVTATGDSGGSGLLIKSILTGAGLQAVIGAAGDGTFSALSGAQVNIDGSVTVGEDKGGSGTLTASGTGTKLGVAGDPIIGMDGTGTFIIQSGAGVTITNDDLTLGEDATGLGTVDVSDTGTTLQVGGNLVVGGASTLGNQLSVSDGGQVTVTGNGTVGRDANSNGSIDVDGSGSTLHVVALTIGQSGTGAVTIEDSGSLTETSDLILGQNTDSDGTLTIDGSGSTFNYTGGDVTIGSAGKGTFTVSGGALVDLSGTSVTAGDEDGGTGNIRVTGSDSSLSTGDLTIGGTSTGTLEVADGGSLQSGSTTLGDEKGGNGTATVDGDDSKWTVSDLTVGSGGTGQIDIQNRGTVSASGSKLTLGDESTGDGTITLSGAGSVLKFTGEIDDGENGKGVFAVQGGASFTAFSMNIGNMGTGNGTFNIDGAATDVEVQQDFNVGEQGTGALNVTDGAHLLNDSDATLADLGGSGTAVIDSKSVWTIGGDLSVGHQGIGGLQVSAESFVSASNITLGEIAGGGAGTAIISGSDPSDSSTLEYDNILKVGDGGNGELDVDSGATVKDSGKGTETDAGSLDIAAQKGSTGEVNVDGNGSSLSATNINVGGTAAAAGGSGSISVTNGGSINASGVVTVQAKGTVSVEAKSSLTAGGGVMVNAGGLLGGGGTIHGNVTNAGTVAPGDPQITTIDGNYTQTAGGFLVLDVEGTTLGAYDQLDVNGELSIDPGATLKLDFENGFAPSTGETFNLIGYKSLDPLNFGFSSVDITGLAAGFNYVITPVGTGGTDFQLTALNSGVSTTPEPSTWVLVLAGMSLIASKARRMTQCLMPSLSDF